VGNLEQTIDQLAQLIDIQPRDRRASSADGGEQELREPAHPHQADRRGDGPLPGPALPLPGVDIKARLFRNYPLGDTASHLLGYIGRINQAEKTAMEDWDEDRQANYRGTEYIGKLGLEQSYEAELHGRPATRRWRPPPAAAPCGA
jgi:penicillin-binding protein 2